MEGPVLPKTVGEISEVMNRNENLVDKMIEQLKNNPDAIADSMSATVPNISPENLDAARGYAMSGQGTRLLRQLQDQGIDPRALASKSQKEMRLRRGLEKRASAKLPTKKCILVTTARKLKERDLYLGELKRSAELILRCTPVSIPCSRLQLGPWENLRLTGWYSPSPLGGRNKRSSKLIGFEIASELILVATDLEGNHVSITTAQLEAVEKLLGQSEQ